MANQRTINIIIMLAIIFILFIYAGVLLYNYEKKTWIFKPYKRPTDPSLYAYGGESRPLTDVEKSNLAYAMSH